MDQAIQCYKFPRKPLKWWFPVFYHLLEIAMNNSMIWYRKHYKKEIEPSKFREEISEGLLIG